MFVIPKAEELPKLSECDEKNPLSRFYYQGAQTPPAEVMQYIDIDKPMDVSLAVAPEHVNDLLEPGYMEREAGWCIFPDGIGYSASLIKMPQVSEEANNWWGPWHEQDDLRYKLWCPGAHQRVGMRWCQEDVGMGLENVFFMQRLTPEIVGLDPVRLRNNDSIILVRGQNGYCMPVNAGPEQRPLAIVVMHMIRRLPEGGIEYRSRFWSGMWFINGKPVRMIPEDVSIPAERAYGLANHGAYEMATLGKILPELYAEYGPYF